MTAVGVEGGLEEGQRGGGGGETSVCMAVRQLSCQRTHHISTAQPARFPLQLFPPAFIYCSPSPPHPFCLSFMRTKANKQQNICMLSQHMRRQRQSQSQSQRCQARHCSCAPPAPPTAAEVFCIAKQKF